MRLSSVDTRRRLLSRSLALALQVTLLPPLFAGPVRYQDSDGELEARTKGRRVVRELAIDLDGDGRMETAVVEREGAKLSAVVFLHEGAEDDPRFVPWVRSSPALALRVERFALEPMCPWSSSRRPGQMLVAVFESTSPDERDLSMRILGVQGEMPKELFARKFVLPKVSPRVSVRDPTETTPHYRFIDGEPCVQLSLVHGPQILELPGRQGPEPFVIGAYRSLFAFDHEAGRFRVTRRREAVDRRPPHPPRDVTATVQAPKIWGTAQAFWATDGRRETSWSVRSSEAKGQRISVRFRRPVSISLIRVVPGCAADEETWEQNDRLRSFDLVIGKDRRFAIDREVLTRIPPGVRAIGEFPLVSGFGSQVIVVLERPVSALFAGLEIHALEGTNGLERARAPEACLAELSFH